MSSSRLKQHRDRGANSRGSILNNFHLRSFLILSGFSFEIAVNTWTMGTVHGSDNIFFYDGVCGLCNRSVDFILRHDRKKRFKFAPLQGEKALELLLSAGLPKPDLTTSILYRSGRFYTKSDAFLLVLRDLGLPWAVFAILRFVPRFLRDGAYDFVSANRLKIFGATEICRMPSAETRERFI